MVWRHPRVHLERDSALCSEDGRDLPAAQEMSHDSLLSRVPGGFPHHVGVVNEMDVEGLRPVLVVQVEGVNRGKAAG